TMREAESSRKTLLMTGIRQSYKRTNKMKGGESVHLQCSTGTGLDKTQHEREVGHTGTCARRRRHVKLRSQNTREYHGDSSFHKCESNE
ncbi:mCG1044137, partial [Mus musculus]